MQEDVETGELPVPETAVEGNPLRGVPQRRRLQAAAADAAGLAGFDQAGVDQHAQVLGDRRQRHRMRLGERGHGLLTAGQLGEDSPARPVRQRRERAVERRRQIVNHMVYYYSSQNVRQ